MLILEFNPEYNILKVVGGSVSGLVRKVESMQPSFLKLKQVTYFYDYLNKELLYISDSRKQLCGILNMNYDILSKYLYSKNKLYLGRFFISNEPLNLEGYTENLLTMGDHLQLFDLVNSHKISFKSEISRINGTKSKGEQKAINLINIKTGEQLEFESIADTSRYLQKLDPSYKASTGTLSYTVNKGGIYKGTFRLVAINKRSFSTLAASR